MIGSYIDSIVLAFPTSRATLGFPPLITGAENKEVFIYGQDSRMTMPLRNFVTETNYHFLISES
jgi:hypothetical protein